MAELAGRVAAASITVPAERCGGWSQRKAVRVRAKLKARGHIWQRKARWALEVLAGASRATPDRGARASEIATAAAAAGAGGVAASRLGARVFDRIAEEDWAAAGWALAMLAEAHMAGQLPIDAAPTAGVVLIVQRLGDQLQPAATRALAADALRMCSAATDQLGPAHPMPIAGTMPASYLSSAKPEPEVIAILAAKLCTVSDRPHPHHRPHRCRFARMTGVALTDIGMVMVSLAVGVDVGVGVGVGIA